VLGLGHIGGVTARLFHHLGFRVTGWSRSTRRIEGIACHHGADGLHAALTGAQVVVLLLPLTPDTESLMDAARLALPAPGAVLLNPGRGALVDDAALLSALDAGQIGHATLDVFRVEPLPAAHPFWTHPHVTVTPHVASTTRPETAAPRIAAAIAALEAGQRPAGLVDRARGY